MRMLQKTQRKKSDCNQIFRTISKHVHNIVIRNTNVVDGSIEHNHCRIQCNYEQFHFVSDFLQASCKLKRQQQRTNRKWHSLLKRALTCSYGVSNNNIVPFIWWPYNTIRLISMLPNVRTIDFLINQPIDRSTYTHSHRVKHTNTTHTHDGRISESTVQIDTVRIHHRCVAGSGVTKTTTPALIFAHRR